MLTIDKAKDSQRLIVTVTENATSEVNAFKLQVHSTFTKKTFEVELGENQSPYPERFDEFILEKNVYSDWNSGLYAYTITEINSNKVVEIGNLSVIGGDSKQPQFISITKAETEDDFLVYKKK